MLAKRAPVHTAPMTQPRRQLVDPTQAQFFHLINRCVRRSWLCGFDSYSKKEFEHRKAWLKTRILELGDISATGIYACGCATIKFARMKPAPVKF